MTTVDLSQAVRALLEARRSGRQVAPPFALPDRDAVYAIQDGVAKATGPVSGWKVGARTPTAAPNPAPLLAGALVKSPGRFDGKAMHMIGVEIEISFHIVRDIAARAQPVGRDEALAAVGDAFVGMEVVDTRLANFKARIVSDAIYDDGVEANHIFEIEAHLHGRKHTFSVAAAQFASLNWVVSNLGAGAYVEAGIQVKDRVRVAIQRLSEDIAERRFFPG